MSHPVRPCPPEARAVQPEKFPMPDLPTPPGSLADVLHRLQDHPGLPDTRRRDLASAVRGLSGSWGDYAASAQCSPETGAGPNSWPKPEPSAPL
jgi:hypothetical protein